MAFNSTKVNVTMGSKTSNVLDPRIMAMSYAMYKIGKYFHSVLSI